MTQADLDSLVPEVAPRNRRDFLKTAVGSAFALAVLPVAAETITTDTQGLDAGETLLDVPGVKMPVYYARPAGKTHLPTVIVVSEIFGVHQHIADICRRFAKLGYFALAPELFSRAGDPQSLGTIAEIQSQIVAKTPDNQVLGDIDATVKWAVANGGDEAVEDLARQKVLQRFAIAVGVGHDDHLVSHLGAIDEALRIEGGVVVLDRAQTLVQLAVGGGEGIDRGVCIGGRLTRRALARQ